MPFLEDFDPESAHDEARRSRTMSEAFDAARLHREELDREIEAIRAERLISSAAAPKSSLRARVRTGLGRRLIWLGTSVLGTPNTVPRDAHLER